jgi:hypothetical protein
MSCQGFKVRGGVLAVLAVGVTAGLAGCKTVGDVNGGSGDGGGEPRPLLNPSFISFKIDKDAKDPTLLVVSPAYGDAWLDAEPTAPAPGEDKNKIVWTSDYSYDIKFVSIDDPAKNPRKKFGPTQKNDWNKIECKSGPPCRFELPLFTGNGKSRKEIVGAKYMLRSPSGCTTGCAYLDPIIIVRY